jgi:hypothetical protein
LIQEGVFVVKIIEKVRLIMAANAENDAAAIENARKAVAAIQGGIQSLAWEEYMRQFVDNNNPTQLARLKGTDGTLDDLEVSSKRAYLAANAVCAPGSTALDRNVESIDH